MKKLLFIIPLMLLFHDLNAQSIVGEWRINALILDAETKEYTLHKKDSNRFHSGNNLSLKPDGTFESYYTAPCGNDCFTKSYGRYKIINSSHLTLFLEKITKHGECSGEFEPNKSLGVYAIHYDEDKIRLLKSNSLILHKEELK